MLWFEQDSILEEHPTFLENLFLFRKKAKTTCKFTHISQEIHLPRVQHLSVRIPTRQNRRSHWPKSQLGRTSYSILDVNLYSGLGQQKNRYNFILHMALILWSERNLSTEAASSSPPSTRTFPFTFACASTRSRDVGLTPRPVPPSIPPVFHTSLASPGRNFPLKKSTGSILGFPSIKIGSSGERIGHLPRLDSFLAAMSLWWNFLVFPIAFFLNPLLPFCLSGHRPKPRGLLLLNPSQGWRKDRIFGAESWRTISFVEKIQRVFGAS